MKFNLRDMGTSDLDLGQRYLNKEQDAFLIDVVCLRCRDVLGQVQDDDLGGYDLIRKPKRHSLQECVASLGKTLAALVVRLNSHDL